MLKRAIESIALLGVLLTPVSYNQCAEQGLTKASEEQKMKDAYEQKLKVGDNAPSFSLPDQDGKMRKLSEFKGKWVVLYFFPKALTPG